ncbi:MAG: hypothetical protein GC168_21035 [Candidatus Hydrogenedens sp.]|nr:hypothetical protein [Candidatus Hydrogenedens sp.]
MTVATAVPAEIVVEHVIGKEYPGDYKHPASITEIGGKELYVSYYGGGGEYEDDSKVWGMRRALDSDTWSEPVVIADTPFLAEGNPVVWEAPDGVVWLFYVQRYGDTWSQSRIKGKISLDGAKTWSDSFMVAFEQGMMVRARPITLMDGDYLLPVYHETGSDRENVGADTTSLFLRFNPKTHAWTESNRIYSRLGNLQPSPVQIDENYLISYSRRGGGYDPMTDGYLVRSESHDGGHTWSKGEDSAFPNPNAATDFIKLANGHLVLAYNDNMNDRTPLTVAISEDDDKTWPHKRDIGTGDNTFAYPMLIQTTDGKIRLLYTTDNRATVMLATFDEADIVGHTK